MCFELLRKLTFFFFTLPAPIYHEWIIEQLWTWTGFQLSHRRLSPPTGSYQEAQPESDQWDVRCTGEERQLQWSLREWLFWFLEFRKNPIHWSQVTSGCPTHHRHQSHIWEQPHQTWQHLLRRQYWGDGEQCFCQPKLLIRSLWGSGATLLTSWMIFTLVLLSTEAILFILICHHRPQLLLRYRRRLSPPKWLIVCVCWLILWSYTTVFT